MRWSSTFLSLVLLLGSCTGQSVDNFVSSEFPIAKAGLLANIGPDGSKASGANSGIVIASPSTENPNYLYTWIRDSSLVAQVIIDLYTTGADTSLRGHIDNFVRAYTAIQQVPNPSGNVSTGGLGEPKFNINGTAFTDPWGRPQRDGPALRASALITWANYLLGQDNTTYVTDSLWPVIKLDIDYVSSNWNQSTFDLWEEIDSSSFFTSAVQHRSLRQGISLANKLGQPDGVDAWKTQADNVLCFMQSYWNPDQSYMTANTGGGRSGIDSNTILATIHTFDADAGCDSTTFQPCSDRALSNLLVYINSFRSIYGLNSGLASDVGIATGRYQEDVYFNGNPWYLCTLAVSEQLYDAFTVWSQQKSLSVTSLSLPFFRLFSSSISEGTYDSSTAEFASLTSAIKTYADSFVSVVQKYTPSSGGLSEQYDKSTGSPLSAVDLTWSYASAITAFNARNGSVPVSWGAKGLSVPEGECQDNPGPTVNVTFNVQAETQFGENIYITGSVPALKAWSPDQALLLNADNYPTWSITVTLPATTNIEYKYIRKTSDGSVTWESDPNNSIQTPADGTFTENDTWR